MLHGLIEELLADGARQGSVRGDIAPGELASYCLHALAAAGDLPSRAAVDRLVAVTLAGVHAAATPTAASAPGTDSAAAHRGHRPALGSGRHE
ncbi:SbtR family transcriptional regulator [Streptomyces werraensis]|uniref:SbtR family transcriptional regulator n=1 Tax=Streptomyces werraensis TaxID=68284 RepID=UPI0036802D04